MYGNGSGDGFISHIFYVDIFKCALQHFVGDFARLLYGAVHNLCNVTSRIHRCPQNRMSTICFVRCWPSTKGRDGIFEIHISCMSNRFYCAYTEECMLW